jgi:uncharacterized protein
VIFFGPLRFDETEAEPIFQQRNRRSKKDHGLRSHISTSDVAECTVHCPNYQFTLYSMQTSFFSVLYPVFIKSLEALSDVLQKAEAHAKAHSTENRSFEDALLNDRIIFDQYPLVRQVQIATDQAKNSVKRITGKDVPKFEDTETTFAQLQDRIAKTLEIVRAVKPEDVNDKEEVRVSLPYWDGKSLSAYEYATMYLIPNFFFHVTTAYAIIRKNGVAIGKDDFTGELPFT